MVTTDVFVVGGGPAGLAAALAARAQGLQVMLADCAKPPIDKTCGEGLMPDSLAALRKLGIRIDAAAESFPFRGIRFLGRAHAVDANFPQGSGLGMRRPVLHHLLVKRAEEDGVSTLWGSRVSGLTGTGVVMDGQEVACRWVIGADGQNSRVRRWAGLDSFGSESSRYGFRRHYSIAPWTDCMEIYWGSGCQMYVTPVSPQEVCVVLISRDPRLRIAHVEAQFPQLMDRLKNAGAVTPERGAVSVSRGLKRVCGGRVALIGDASGSVDAITGEGLCLSFQQALTLADSLRADDLAGYQRWHGQTMRRPAFMADAMLMLDRFPAFREPALRILSARPALFSRMLAMHVGELSTALAWRPSPA